MKSMTQVLEEARAKRMAARTRYFVKPEEIQNARRRLELSQEQFADVFGVSASTLRKWEQGQYAPSGAAIALLKVIAVEPEAVLRALSKTSPQDSTESRIQEINWLARRSGRKGATLKVPQQQ
jgi:putative transcriptional regulator